MATTNPSPITAIDLPLNPSLTETDEIDDMVDPLPDTDAAVAFVRRLAEKARQDYGDRIQEVWLYGSRARGDQDPESDLDMMLVTDNPRDKDFQDSLWDLQIWVEDQDIIPSFLLSTKEQIDKWDTRLYRNIRKDGIKII